MGILPPESRLCQFLGLAYRLTTCNRLEPLDCQEKLLSFVHRKLSTPEAIESRVWLAGFQLCIVPDQIERRVGQALAELRHVELVHR